MLIHWMDITVILLLMSIPTIQPSRRTLIHPSLFQIFPRCVLASANPSIFLACKFSLNLLTTHICSTQTLNFKVPEAKIEKLTKVIIKVLARIGTLASCEETGYNGVHIPFNEDTKLTNGFAFVEYETSEDAEKAAEVLKDYKFDKNHILLVTPYEKALALKDVPEEFEEPEPAPFVEKSNTSTWMLDASQRDQFVIRQGKETVVYWNDAKNDPIVDYDGAREKKAGTSWCGK